MNRALKLKDFEKPSQDKTGCISSVNLRPDQREFIQANNINLSKLVRALIDSVMIQDNKKK